jgi:hypothetical protein
MDYVGSIIFEKNEKLRKLGKIVETVFKPIFSQNNGRRQLLLQNDIILEIITQN